MSDITETVEVDVLASLQSDWKKIPAKQRETLTTLASVVATREQDRDALASLKAVSMALRDASASLASMSRPTSIDADAWALLVSSSSSASAMSAGARSCVGESANAPSVRESAGRILAASVEFDVADNVVEALKVLTARYDATVAPGETRKGLKRTSGEPGDLGFRVTITCEDHPNFKRTANSRKHLQNVPLVHLQSEHSGFAMDKATRTALVSSITEPGVESVSVGSVTITRS